MKKFTVTRAQSIYSLAPSIFATLPVVDLAEDLKAKYQFRHSPTIQELSNQLNQPISFASGKADLGSSQSVSIETLTVQNFVNLATTVSVITRSDTDDSDAVLADLIEWASSKFAMNTAPVMPTNYLSQAEIILDQPIGEGLDVFKSLSARITDLIKGYGFTNCPAFEPTALVLWYDNTQTTKPPTVSLNFSIDRRAGAPFSANKYFTQAPLKTGHHRAIVLEFERILFSRGA